MNTLRLPPEAEAYTGLPVRGLMTLVNNEALEIIPIGRDVSNKSPSQGQSSTSRQHLQ